MRSDIFLSSFSARPGSADVWEMYSNQNHRAAADMVRSMNRHETVSLLNWALRTQPADSALRFHSWVGKIV